MSAIARELWINKKDNLEIKIDFCIKKISILFCNFEEGIRIYTSFIKTIKSMVSINDNEIEDILHITTIKSIEAGEYFIREGEIPNKFAFVIKGLFRYFYDDIKGNEFTKGFFPENTFITSYSAMIQNRESFYTIEAMENSNILIIEYKDWQKLFKNNVCWNKFLIALLEKGYGIKESREREFLLYDAEKRYQSFLDNFPNLENRVKQHYIASYLGITPVALSRIKKKRKELT